MTYLWVSEETGELMGAQYEVIQVSPDRGYFQGAHRSFPAIRRPFRQVRFHPREDYDPFRPLHKALRLPNFDRAGMLFDMLLDDDANASAGLLEPGEPPPRPERIELVPVPVLPLVLLPKKAAVVAQVLGPRIGLNGDMDGFVGSIAGPPVARRGANSSGQAAYARMGGVALIGVVGSLISRGSYLEAESGLVSYDRLKSAILAADRDADVTSIVLDLDTPGGVAAGAFECADVIYQVSRRRPVVAVANQMACSAGYAIAAAANRTVAARRRRAG